MRNIPTRERLDRIPKLNETNEVPLEDKLVYLHFSIKGFHWYVFEFDGDDRFRGNVVWYGYSDHDIFFSFEALKSMITEDGLHEVECDPADKWIVRKVSEIEELKSRLSANKKFGQAFINGFEGR